MQVILVDDEYDLNEESEDYDNDYDEDYEDSDRDYLGENEEDVNEE
jgi:hypothetical protein